MTTTTSDHCSLFFLLLLLSSFQRPVHSCIFGFFCGNNNKDENKNDQTQPKKVTVGAYYYGWHAYDFHGDGYVREFLRPSQEPELGEYSDREDSVIAQHLEWSNQGNINMWACTWWGPGSLEDQTLLEDILPYIESLDENSIGSDMQISIMYETKGRTSSLTDYSKIRPDFEYIAETYFHRSNYYRINGRPVVFLYDAGPLFLRTKLDDVINDMREGAASKGYDDIYIVGDGAFWKALVFYLQPLKYIDAVTNYNVYGSMGRTGYAGQDGVDQYYKDQSRWKQYANWVDTAYIPAATPGFNDRGVRDENEPLSRKLNPDDKFGSLFESMLDQAVDLTEASTGHLLMITSFNEWHEDTQVEPVKVAYPTNRDVSQSNAFYTDGLEYEGYEEKYLDILREKTT